MLGKWFTTDPYSQLLPMSRDGRERDLHRLPYSKVIHQSDIVPLSLTKRAQGGQLRNPDSKPVAAGTAFI